MINEITQYNYILARHFQSPGPFLLVDIIVPPDGMMFNLTSVNASWAKGPLTGEGFGLVGFNTSFIYWSGAADGSDTWMSMQFTPALPFNFVSEHVNLVSTISTSQDIAFGGYFSTFTPP